MANIKSNLDDKTRRQINKTNYKKAINALEQSKFDDFVPIKKNKDILKLSLKPKVNDIKNTEKFFELITALFQSMTTQCFTTYEIVSFISEELNNFKPNDKVKIIEFLEKSYTIVHSNYQNKLTRKNYQNVARILFNHFKEDEFGAYTDLGYKLIGLDSSVNRDIKTLSLTKKESIIQKIADSSNNKLDKDSAAKLFEEYYSQVNINKDIKNPTKINPSFSCILVNNPDVKIGSRNSLELATFFNSISNVEFDRAYPYFNAEFIVPNFSRQDSNAVMSAASINQFINGSLKKSKTTSNYKQFEGKKVKRGDDTEGKVIKTNMALFTTPQTLVNLDEKIGYSDSTSSLRLTSIKDSTQPFMTLKNLSINVSPTKGFMSFKTGKLSLILHDRSRLPDIAPFVKHDLFGSFGAEIIVEYGWSHLDEDNPSLNPVGAFLGNSKVKEVYMITNSSFSMDQAGQINIDLSISMKGASVLKNTEINFLAENRIKVQTLKSLIATVESCRQSLNLSSYESGVLSRLSNDNILNPVSQIDSTAAAEISSFIFNYSFLTLPDLENNYELTQLATDKDLFEFKVSIKETNNLLGAKSQFLSLIFGDRLDDSNDPNERIISSPYNQSEVSRIINDILSAYKDLRILSDIILKQDIQEPEIEAAVLESIVGGIDFIDPFYPTNKELYENLKEPASFVTFGAVLSSLLQTHVLSKVPQDFDEIQTIFYTANRYAAGMKDKNLSTFLIPKTALKEFIKKEIKKEGAENNVSKTGKGITVLTVESLISQIINKFIVTKNNPMFGLSDLYKLDEKTQTVIAANEDKDKQATSVERKLHEIYYPGEGFSSKNDVTFKVPSIKMNFDSLNSETSDISSSKTILRISIYDQNDSPFDAISNILEKLYLKDFNKSIDSIAKIKNKYGKIGSNSLYEDKVSAELKTLIEKKFLKVKNNKYVFDPLAKIENSKNKASIKSFYKELFPSLTFGTQHTAMLSANVSTVNDNKLASVYITRSDRNNQSEINSRIKSDLPLRVLPTQATIETFGCPWVNFGQFIFLDFDTGTTIDNKYAVTGISHNLTPGGFKTSLTLSYGDVYGQYEAAADLIDSVTSRLNTSKEIKLPKNSPSNNGLSKTVDSDLKIQCLKLNLKNIGKIEKRLVYINESSVNVNSFKANFSNVLYSDNFQNFSSILLYQNSFVENRINRTKKSGKSAFVGEEKTFLQAFTNRFQEYSKNSIDVHVVDSPEKDFKFNVMENNNNNKNNSLILQKNINSEIEVLLQNPKCISTTVPTEKSKLDSIEYNQTNLVEMKKLKQIIIKEHENNALKKSFENYYNLLNAIEEVRKKNAGMFSLKVATLNLEDMFSKAFIDANKDILNFGGYRGSEANRDLTEAEVVRIETSTDSNKKEYIKNIKKFDHLSRYNIDSATKRNSKVEYNIKKIKSILENGKNDKRKLLSYQTFPIFKSIKLEYSSNIKISSIDRSVVEEFFSAYYEVVLDKEILKKIYSSTSIKEISVINNKTSDPELQILTMRHNTVNDFVKYDKNTAKSIEIQAPDIRILSIFNVNYNEYDNLQNNVNNHGIKFNSVGLTESSRVDSIVSTPEDTVKSALDPVTGSRAESIQMRMKGVQQADSSEEGLSDHIQLFKYTLKIKDIIEDVKKSTKTFLTHEAGKELYIHNKEKTLGINYTRKEALKRFFENGKIYNISKKEHEKTASIKSASNLNENDLNKRLEGDFSSIEKTNFTSEPSGNNTENTSLRVAASDSVYKGIKEKNLPVVDKDDLFLKVMEKWIPPAETSSQNSVGNVDYNLTKGSVIDYAKLANNFKNNAKTLNEFKEKLNATVPQSNRFVSFKALKASVTDLNKPYLDYKVSDLLIQDATPDSARLGEKVVGTISYVNSIKNNKKQLSATIQRRTKIQPYLFYLLKYAAEFVLSQESYRAKFDAVLINSGGDIPLYLAESRNLSTTIRHDSGYGVDVMLINKGKKLVLQSDNKDKNNEVIWAFLNACKEFGATGIGADYDYEKGHAFHIDISNMNQDFKTGEYKRDLNVKAIGGLKSKLEKEAKEDGKILLGNDGQILNLKSKNIKGISSIESVRYWGKSEGGSFKKEAAPKELKNIYGDK